MEKKLEKSLENKSVMVLDQLAYRFSDNNVVGTGAQLTYFLLLSIFPFLIVLLNALSMTSLASEEMIGEFIQYVPADVEVIISSFLNDVIQSSSQGLLSIAAIGGLWTASSGVKAVIRAINKAYDYSENRSFLKLKGLSLVFTLFLLIMIILVFMTLVLGELIGKLISDYLGIQHLFLTLWRYLRFAIPLFFMILTFALLYKYSPNIRGRHSISLRTTLPGAIFSSLAWIALSVLFSYYVSSFGNYAVTYGSLGGVIVLLVWLFISSIVIVLGGEINATLECLKRNGFKPSEEKSIILGLLDRKAQKN